MFIFSVRFLEWRIQIALPPLVLGLSKYLKCLVTARPAVRLPHSWPQSTPINIQHAWYSCWSGCSCAVRQYRPKQRCLSRSIKTPQNGFKHIFTDTYLFFFLPPDLRLWIFFAACFTSNRRRHRWEQASWRWLTAALSQPEQGRCAQLARFSDAIGCSLESRGLFWY